MPLADYSHHNEEAERIWWQEEGQWPLDSSESLDDLDDWDQDEWEEEDEDDLD